MDALHRMLYNITEAQVTLLRKQQELIAVADKPFEDETIEIVRRELARVAKRLQEV